MDGYLGKPGQVDDSLKPRFPEEKGVGSVDMPPPKERIGRAMVKDTAVGEVRAPLQAGNSVDGVPLPIQDQGDLFPPAHSDRRGDDVGISVFGEDHIWVKPLQEGIDL